MTRVNTIPPKYLCDKHLVAEYREILRVVGLSEKSASRDIPKEYRLGSGHIIFFYNKIGYIKNRFNLLRQEMLNRKMNPTMECENASPDWFPKQRDHIINIERLILRTPKSGKYYRKEMSRQDYIQILSECLIILENN